MSYFDKFILKLNLAAGQLGLKPIYVGAFGGEGLNNQFASTEHLENFGFGDKRLKEINFDTVFIVGHLNFVQTDLLSYLLEQRGDLVKNIFYIYGPLSEDLRSRSYFISDSIEDTFKPKLVYKKYPIDFSDLYSQIETIQHESLHGRD